MVKDRMTYSRTKRATHDSQSGCRINEIAMEPATFTEKMDSVRRDLIRQTISLIVIHLQKHDHDSADGCMRIIWQLHRSGVKSFEQMRNLQLNPASGLIDKIIAAERKAVRQLQFAVNKAKRSTSRKI